MRVIGPGFVTRKVTNRRGVAVFRVRAKRAGPAGDPVGPLPGRRPGQRAARPAGLQRPHAGGDRLSPDRRIRRTRGAAAGALGAAAALAPAAAAPAQVPPEPTPAPPDRCGAGARGPRGARAAGSGTAGPDADRPLRARSRRRRSRPRRWRSPSAPRRSGRPVQRSQRHGLRSYFAFVDDRAMARAKPRAGAKPRARLRLTTEDGTDELVTVLARTRDASGRSWLQVRLRCGPTTRRAGCGSRRWAPLHRVRTWLRIDTEHFRISLLKAGRVVFRAQIGVGQPQWPTPHGEYYLRSRLSGYGVKGAFYGPIAFGTSAHSDQLTDWPAGGIVGIHGTSLPSLIPGRISHGCIRLRNPDILRLDRLITVGTPVTIT